MGRGLIGALAAVGVLLIGGSAWAVVPELSSAISDAEQTRIDDAVLVQVEELHTAVDEWQNYFEPLLAQAGHVETTSLTDGALLAQEVLDQAAVTIDALTSVDLNASSGEVATATAAFADALGALSSVVNEEIGPESAPLIVAERTAYTQLQDVTGTVATQLRETRDAHQDGVSSHLAAVRTRGRAILALSAVMFAVGVVVIGGRARRRVRAELAVGRQQRFETSLQRGLEMAPTEPAVYGIVNRALHESVPDLQVELLVADSSRAHFHQALRTGAGDPEERSGCGVVSPAECPAAKRSDTIVFPTSAAIDACPYLQDRPTGPCSAACIPVSIAGNAIGVLHATATDHNPPDEIQFGYLEATTQRASERITLLRAFEKSETQASTDPLTGLLNRRSLENQVRDLQRHGMAYAVAYGDLDHFKMLNDTHGHEAGDQALRLFSRVLRDSIRPNDIAARYGGEEFVVILPDCGTNAATIVLERVRENLALALTTGRVPAFTVSFGIASSTDAETFDQIVIQADRTLLAAKAAGRNRVIVAGDPAEPTEPIQPKAPTS